MIPRTRSGPERSKEKKRGPQASEETEEHCDEVGGEGAPLSLHFEKTAPEKHMNELVLVLYNIRSRFNVGSIFRTADAAGVNKIYLCGITPAPPHPKIDKVALGAEQFIPFEKIKQTKPILQKLRTDGYTVIALEQSKTSLPYSSLQPRFPLALLVGNEVTGIPKRLLDECSSTIEIPMRGKKESINVAVALGITVFDIIQKQ